MLCKWALPALLMLSAAASAQPAPGSDPLCIRHDEPDALLLAGLREIVADSDLESAVDEGRLAVGLALIPDGEPARFAMLNGRRMIYAASLPKIAILLGGAVSIEQGRLEADPKRIEDLHALIRRSCNDCASRVLDDVGGDWLLDLLRSPEYRLYDAEAGGGLWVGKPYGPRPAFRRDPIRRLSHGANVFQVLRFYCGLERGTLAGPEAIRLMKDALVDPAISHKFVRGLRDRGDLEIMRKSGTWRTYHSDSALIEDGANRYVIAALADDPAAGRWMEELAPALADLADSAAAESTKP